MNKSIDYPGFANDDEVRQASAKCAELWHILELRKTDRSQAQSVLLDMIEEAQMKRIARQ